MVYPPLFIASSFFFTIAPFSHDTITPLPPQLFFFYIVNKFHPKVEKVEFPNVPSKHCTHKEQTAAPLKTSAEAPSQAGKRVERCGRFAHAGPQRVQQVLPPHVLLRRAAHRELARLGQDFHGADQRPLLLRYPGRASTASHRVLDSARGGESLLLKHGTFALFCPKNKRWEYEMHICPAFFHFF